ncbi:sensor histidine kinase [Paenibacillus aurantius]|uniref:Sensor histidine kinase n=1 Tax=Paenibacillus aurantius TaxID=2918900 RepID=A0AA96LJD3_9BACL|nr:sensor histidine kinase [Paenibacillus aurantius]WNQ13175.1 sensor histidine kinase [Paenibacillus aurantius]
MLRLIRSSLRWKLLTVIVSILILVLAAVGVFSFVDTSRTIQSDVERFSSQIMKQANLNFSRYNRDNEQFFVSIGGSTEFADWLKADVGDRYELFRSYRAMEQKYIDPFVRFHPEVLSVRMYNENGNESIYRSPGVKYNLILRTDYSMAQESWLKELTLSGRMVRLTNQSSHYTDGIGRPVKTPVLTFVQKFQYGNRDGYLAVDISLMPTQEILQEIGLGQESEGVIVDQNGKIIVHQNVGRIGEQIPSGLMEEMSRAESSSFFYENQMVVDQRVPDTDWHMLVIVPYEEVAQSIYRVKNMTILIAIAGLVVSTLLIFLVSGSITKRLKELRKTIKVTDAGRFDVRVEVKGTDEVAELAGTYNRLLDRIESSIREMTESRVFQQEAVLSALQAQINSHFLYNALESINSMANLNDQEDIGRTAVALSNMLRYTSNYQDTVVTLEEELSHLKDYMYILNILYGDEISLDVEMTDELRRVTCLKALIQPFVENSIKHGYEVTGEKMTIRLTAAVWNERYLRIAIQDNGEGIPESKLEELQQMLAQEVTDRDYKRLSRIGILNVHYRIRMFYPQAHTGVTVERSEEGGTIIGLILPLQQGGAA